MKDIFLRDGNPTSPAMFIKSIHKNSEEPLMNNEKAQFIKYNY